jgi:hypothetical protein
MRVGPFSPLELHLRARGDGSGKGSRRRTRSTTIDVTIALDIDEGEILHRAVSWNLANDARVWRIVVWVLENVSSVRAL